MWMVRAGRGGLYASEFQTKSYVGIGWTALGDPTSIRDKRILVERSAEAWPDAKEQSRFVGASIVFRFVNEIAVGDMVVTYDPATRLYLLGTVAGEPTWRDDDEDARSTQRMVNWTGSVPRDALSSGARNSLGAVQTLFLIPPPVAAELTAIAGGSIPAKVELDPTDEAIAGSLPDAFAGLEDQAVERIKDRIVRLDWEEMQDLVAALLRAMGYRTSISARGPDRGRDILATPDGFGFKPPRIIVEVKHRPNQTMGAPEVRAMPVGRQTDDRGLFVSTGGFSREAYYEAEHGKVPITLMTLDDLTRAIIDAYPQFDDDGRALLPLRRLYWPVT
jgi:restriction system protein